MSHGQIDWEEFRSTLDDLKPEDYTHYIQVGIEPCTIETLFKLCSQLTFPPGTKDNLQPSLERSIKATADDNLQNIFKSLYESPTRIQFFGICLVLNRYYTPDSILTIFQKMAFHSSIPADLVPSISSLGTLTSLVTALQISPDFSPKLWTSFNENPNPKLKHMSAEGMVETLITMGQLMRGELQRPILVFAGKDAGFLAAVGDWLFGLKIKLCGEDGKPEFFEHCIEGVPVRLSIRFQNPGVPVDGLPVLTTSLSVKGE